MIAGASARRRAALAAALLAALAGCATAARVPADAGAAAGTQVQLVDSVAWEHELGEGFLRRVEVRHAGRTDTLAGILVREAPVVAGGVLLGLAYHQDEVVSGFRYRPDRRTLARLRLPPDLNPVFSEPALSPDGRHIAYVAVSGDATGWAVVRTWPAGRPIIRSGSVEVPATDMTGGNGSRWLSADTVEVIIETGPVTDEAWHRVRASVSARRVLQAETVRAFPGAAPPPSP